MLRNYFFAFANVVISGFPLIVIFEPIVFLLYCGICIIFILLFCWNSLGDSLIVMHSCHARIVEQDDLIFPALQQYNSILYNEGLIANEGVHYFYTDSKTPYLFSISKYTIIFSKVLESGILDNGANLFISTISNKSYEPKLVLSRKIVLLSVLCYKFILFIMKIWLVLFAFAIKIILAFVMVLVTGALFENPHYVLNVARIGTFIGEIFLFANKIIYYIQDKIIEWAMKKTYNDTFKVLENNNIINR